MSALVVNLVLCAAAVVVSQCRLRRLRRANERILPPPALEALIRRQREPGAM